MADLDKALQRDAITATLETLAGGGQACSTAGEAGGASDSYTVTAGRVQELLAQLLEGIDRSAAQIRSLPSAQYSLGELRARRAQLEHKLRHLESAPSAAAAAAAAAAADGPDAEMEEGQ